MNIKPAIYENLTPSQRVAAAIEALARGDDAEHEKLNETCPKKPYKQADYRYSGTLQALMSMSIAVEHELTSAALSVTLSCLSKADDMDKLADDFLQYISDYWTSWNQTLANIGVDTDAMAKLASPMRHPIVAQILTMELPEADPAAVQKIQNNHEEFLQKLQNTQG